MRGGLSPCQLAVGYMAIRDYSRAIELLAEDLDRNHPLMALLHVWPIFDPLREHEDFKALMQRMNLPKQDN